MPYKVILSSIWVDLVGIDSAKHCIAAQLFVPLPEDFQWLQVLSWGLVALLAALNIFQKHIRPYMHRKKTISRIERIKKTKI